MKQKLEITRTTVFEIDLDELVKEFSQEYAEFCETEGYMKEDGKKHFLEEAMWEIGFCDLRYLPYICKEISDDEDYEILP